MLYFIIALAISIAGSYAATQIDRMFQRRARKKGAPNQE